MSNKEIFSNNYSVISCDSRDLIFQSLSVTSIRGGHPTRLMWWLSGLLWIHSHFRLQNQVMPKFNELWQNFYQVPQHGRVFIISSRCWRFIDLARLIRSRFIPGRRGQIFLVDNPSNLHSRLVPSHRLSARSWNHCGQWLAPSVLPRLTIALKWSPEAKVIPKWSERPLQPG